MRKWLHKLQSAPEATKKKWVFAISAICMAAVVFVWLSFFGALGMAPSRQRAISEKRGSVWSTMKLGASYLASGAKDSIFAIGETLKKPREYIIKP